MLNSNPNWMFSQSQTSQMINNSMWKQLQTLLKNPLPAMKAKSRKETVTPMHSQANDEYEASGKSKKAKGEHTLQRNQHKRCGQIRKPDWLEQYKKSGLYAL